MLMITEHDPSNIAITTTIIIITIIIITIIIITIIIIMIIIGLTLSGDEEVVFVDILLDHESVLVRQVPANVLREVVPVLDVHRPDEQTSSSSSTTITTTTTRHTHSHRHHHHHHPSSSLIIPHHHHHPPPSPLYPPAVGGLLEAFVVLRHFPGRHHPQRHVEATLAQLRARVHDHTLHTSTHGDGQKG
jgi:hypothetical protein